MSEINKRILAAYIELNHEDISDFYKAGYFGLVEITLKIRGDEAALTLLHKTWGNSF